MKKNNKIYKSKYFYTNDEDGENVLVVQHRKDIYLLLTLCIGWHQTLLEFEKLKNNMSQKNK